MCTFNFNKILNEFSVVLLIMGFDVFIINGNNNYKKYIQKCIKYIFKTIIFVNILISIYISSRLLQNKSLAKNLFRVSVFVKLFAIIISLIYFELHLTRINKIINKLSVYLNDSENKKIKFLTKLF